MKWIIIVVITLFSTRVQTQTITFNKRIQVGCTNTVLASLEVTDSCYYAVGFARDSANCQNSSAFIKFDTLGNIIWSKILPNSVKTHEMWESTLKTDFDGNLIVTAYSFDSSKMQGGILKYNTSGNVIWQSFYNNPYTPGAFIRPDHIQITKDSGYIIAATIDEPVIDGGGITLFKLDKNGHKLWQINSDTTPFIGQSRVYIIPTDNSNYLLGYMFDNFASTNNNHTVRCILEKIDSLGNTIWTWQSPSNLQLTGANDLIQTKDGGWVIATGIGTEFSNPGSPNSRFVTDGYVFKLDSARNLLWSKELRGRSSSHYSTISKILELEDSSLIAFGTTTDTFLDATLGPVAQHYGYVVKLSPQGDSLWSHQYHYLQHHTARHLIYDVERTSDQGFLICGQATGSGQGPFQQGWLLKLDQHGCLVPDCQLATGISSPYTTSTIRLSLYPNPTNDYLNIYYHNQLTQKELTFSVVNMQGHILQTYSTTDVSDKTYMLPVHDLVAGTYVLEVRQDGAPLGREQFVKQ